MRTELEIVYEDDSILVVHKPSGLAVQSGGLAAKDVVSLLLNHLAREEAEREALLCNAPDNPSRNGALPYLAVVHRLDQPVQGLLVFAKSKRAAADLSAQVTDGRMQKEYLALVRPEAAGEKLLASLRGGEEQMLTDLLIRDKKTNTSRVAAPGEEGRKDAKKARLYVSLSPFCYKEDIFTSSRKAGTSQVGMTEAGIAEECEDKKDGVLVRVRLLTGRHHQIRVQLAHAGLPIAGDRKYGGMEGLHETKAYPYPALCAARLGFTHPRTGVRMEYTLPDEKIWFARE